MDGDNGVAFRGLQVAGTTAPDDYQRTMGNFPLALLSKSWNTLNPSRKTKVRILRGCDGVVEGGEMLLVLGVPGSGCTTFLKTLAGQTSGLTVEQRSRVEYQGVEPGQEQLRGKCSFLTELDVHFPTLTTKETLDIAARASNQGAPVKRDNTIESTTYDGIISSLSLTRPLGTKVGNEFIRGISGGERKRLSIAEVLVSQASIQCWDNPTRGLDSSNALEFVKALRANTRTRRTAAIVSLYQTSQQVFDMFDKVLLLHEGRQIFFGRADSAKTYFTNLGFLCPVEMTTAEFLTSITNRSRQRIDLYHLAKAPRTVRDFSQAWRESDERFRLLSKIDTFFTRRKRNSLMKVNEPHRPYRVSVLKQIQICTLRGFLRLKNDLGPPISGVVGNAIIAIILGTVFYNLPETTESFFSRSALLFFTTLLNAMVCGFEPGMMWEQRPIVEKHFHYAFFRPFADAIASMICDLPNKILTSIFFNVPVYFLANLRRTPAAFFTYWLFSFTCLLAMSMIFRTIGSTTTTLAGSMAPAAVFILVLIIYAGFTLPVPYMHHWFRWLNYLDPVAYTFESLMINEFHDRTFDCSEVIPSGPGYDSLPASYKACGATGATPDSLVVAGDSYISTSYQYDPTHLWRNFGILTAIMVFACFTHLLSTEYMSIKKSRGETLLFKRSGKFRRSPSHDPESQTSTFEYQLPMLAEANDSTARLVPSHKTINSSAALLVWDDLSYDIKLKKTSRRLLNGVEGWIKRGTLTALMGVSGAGKTTLLNVLADRASLGVIYGDILVERNMLSNGYARNIGYAQQQDVHLSTSTVREALQFSAILRQSPKYSLAERLSYVEEVIDLLDMIAFADAVVGVPGEGLNVEQRKRLTIGVELVARPEYLIFLDEPTSGLDSETAWSICTLLRRLADNGQSILCTIHQPSAPVFQMFDMLLLLAQGGRTAYFGEIGEQSETVVDYFESHGAPALEQHENPAEWLIDITSGSASREKQIDWADKWQTSASRQRVKDEIAQTRPYLSSLNLGKSSNFAAPWHRQLWPVTKRLLQHYWRTPSYFYSKMALCSLTALFIGFSFWQSSNSLQGIQNQIFAAFLLMTAFTNLDQQIISQYLPYRQVYETQESPSRTYHWSVFVLSNFLVELLWQTLASAIMFACWYYPIGFFLNYTPSLTNLAGGGPPALLVFLGIWSFMLFTLTCSFAIISGMESGPTAINIAQLLYSLSLIFCGVLVPPSSLPRFWQFMYRVSPMTYFVSAIISGSTGGGAAVTCAPSELLRFPPPPDTSCGDYLRQYLESGTGLPGALVDAASTSLCEVCPFADTDKVLASVGIAYGDRWWHLGVTFVYSLFNVGVAFALYWLVRVPRRPRIRQVGGE